MIGLWTKFYGYLIAIGSFLLLIAGAVFYGWRKGKTGVQAEVAAAQAQQQVNTAQAIVKRNEVRTDVDAQVAKLPSNPVVPIHVPAPLPVPGSAADELRKDWSRD
jgi:hypothetical protein